MFDKPFNYIAKTFLRSNCSGFFHEIKKGFGIGKGSVALTYINIETLDYGIKVMMMKVGKKTPGKTNRAKHLCSKLCFKPGKFLLNKGIVKLCIMGNESSAVQKVINF